MDEFAEEEFGEDIEDIESLPMRVIYRLVGVDGDATEPVIENLETEEKEKGVDVDDVFLGLVEDGDLDLDVDVDVDVGADVDVGFHDITPKGSLGADPPRSPSCSSTSKGR